MKNLISALVKFQKEVPTIPKNKKNPFFNSFYAELSTVIDTCSPSLNNNGLAVVQTLKAIDNKNTLVTLLCHESGETLESNIYLPDINDPQKLTAAITYLRRTTYLSICGLVADDDDDGESITDKPKVFSDTSKMYQPRESFKSDTGGATEQQKRAIYAISKSKNIEAPKIDSFKEASEWINAQNNKGK